MRVLVIGSGIVGVSSAYFLAKNGAEVTVVDRSNEVAEGGATFANGGMLTPSMADPWNAPGILADMIKFIGKESSPMKFHLKALPSVASWGLKFLANSKPDRFKANLEKAVALSKYSVDVLQQQREELNLEYNHISKGSLKFFRNPDALELARSRVETLAEYGLSIDVLDADGVIKKEPALSEIKHEITGALYCREDGSGDAHAYTVAISKLSRSLGVDYRMGETVTGFSTSDSRINKVITDKASYKADKIVIAAGCWSPLLLSQLGIRLPVRPVKGYSLTVPMGNWKQTPKMPLVDNCQHVAVSIIGDNIRLAGTAEIAGYDSKLSSLTIDKLFATLTRIYPSFEPHIDQAKSRQWTGLRPVSADGVPHIGRTKYENLYLNTGHGHLGWTMGPGTGKLLADIISGNTTGIDASLFEPRC